ncbi:hypothetical protein G6011_04021 [Alternaria panax]|uniref:Protein kinase domain-containing protein n=1 Tax=Alternaria panax TaxID=48097 RepID=A0AAD4NS22_9PLEO|nr:hypothetical protein G6011_04021 [Alternaria panax]
MLVSPPGYDSTINTADNHGQLPPPPAPAPAFGVVPAPGPAPAAAAAAVAPVPAPPIGAVADVPTAQGVDAGTQAAHVNTTDLLNLPSLRVVNQNLPPMLEISDSEEEDEQKRKAASERRKRKLEKAKLCNPGQEESTKDWRCTHLLGRGATGTVTLWVGVDESRTIVEKLAIRNTLMARDVIPESGILDVNLQKDRLITGLAWAWYTFTKKRRLKRGLSVPATINNEPAPPSSPLMEEYENMSGIADWHDNPLPDKLPDFIPEWFLWIVFDQLVDAYTMLGSGRTDEEDDDVDWNEIVHRDGHLMKIFVKTAEGAIGKEIKPEGEHCYRQFSAHEAPSVVLADFDLAFFDLQSEDDIYADNPTYYMMRNHPHDAEHAGGRYAPEFFWCYEGHHQNGRASEKMTAKTDVWQVRQMMWNLVMNLPGSGGYRQEPFTYTLSDDGEGIEKQLSDGSKYDIDRYKNDLFSGKTTFEASGMYSETSRDTIIMCMDYRQHKRWSFANLKRVTEEWAGKEPPPDSRAREDLIITVSESMEEFGLGKTYERSKKRRKRGI